ncbi:3'(2'),5'-bisphosphate nucleotidase CysQ [Aurantimonas sp. DM33-3]|uniref:3'(2'),5'-bisphosphate nucleotidase CysQ family protein n=1 Tax=Aurantimonas sp. DM33-3 TaxID=2766955 RepID=UPI001651C198|nr:inositol monophosphatase family protein [Aurantimonas sp. DM33-3]MBC6716198.1 3'(2'),5'-bisphosphate nucleotidase CysQ [Aurantimonas sp. DM33-3]
MSDDRIDTALMIDAVRAGMAAIRAQTGSGVDYKSDRSPVTEADKAAERAIVAVIQGGGCTLPIVAEEAFSDGEIPAVGRRFLLVDPLDGTKSYIAGTPDYTVNVAVIEDGAPVFGCVGIPETGTIYHGGAGTPAMVERDGAATPLACRKAGAALDVVASRNHLDDATRDYIGRLDVAERKSIGSSLKFCLLAEAEADLYPRFGRTMQWDTAAGDAVLRAAGGLTITMDGTPLAYGRTHAPGEDVFGNPHFIALGDRALLDRPGIVPQPAERQ